ncbi:MAG: hypothetical protein ACYC6F_09370 [Longimicrobiales bacterium]
MSSVVLAGLNAVMSLGLAVASQDTARAPFPAEPPLGGPGWTVVVPAILFLVTAAGTWALWRRFADQDDKE